MTDEAALIAAIAAAPDDDGPRLLYADLADDRGDAARAEFIRVQVALAKTVEFHPDAAPLRAREAELLRSHGDGWKIPKLRARQEFHRGFVDRVWIRGDRLAVESFRLQRHPIVTRLRVSGIDREVDVLTELPWLERVTELDLTNNLGVRWFLTELLEANPMPRLKSLIVRNVQLWPEELQLLFFKDECLSELESLDLSGNPLGDEGMRQIVASERYAHCRSLTLRADGVDHTETIGDRGFEALAGAPVSGTLERLDLTGHRPTADGLAALLSSKLGDHLTHLAVTVRSSAGPAWFESLMRAPFPKLKTLALKGRNDEWDVSRIADWPPLRRGAYLDLRQFGIDEYVEETLRDSPMSSQIVLATGDA